MTIALRAPAFLSILGFLGSWTDRAEKPAPAPETKDEDDRWSFVDDVITDCRDAFSSEFDLYTVMSVYPRHF